jgi:predicted NBD/HSP70 family sugar kinase
MAGGSITEMRRRNRDIVLQEIVSSPLVSRSQIAQRTGLTGAAVSRITRELIDVGLITEGETVKVKGQVGRRNIGLELASGGAFVLGIALTANTQSISIGDSRGAIIAQRRIDGLDLNDPVATVAQLARAADDLARATKSDPARIVGCGFAVGGVVDPGSGVLIRSDPLGWNDVPLAALASEKLGLPVKLEGRAVALLLAEQKEMEAAARRNVVLISNGLWVGGAMMLDGQIVKGHANMIGQIGHFSVRPDGATCVCGRKGCLDAEASGLAILRDLSHLDLGGDARPQEPGDRLSALAQHNGPHTQEISAAFRKAGRKMGYAVDALLSILDPEQVLLTGATHRQPDFIQGIRETLGDIRPGAQDWPVKVSRVTSDQSAIWLGLNAFVYSPSLNIDQLKNA